MNLMDLFVKVAYDDKDVDKGIEGTVGKSGKFGQTLAKGFGAITAAVGVISTGLVALGTAGLKYNSQMEQYQTSFEVMLGSEEKAIALTEKLKEKAASTPFEMTDLANTTQLLLNYGIAADEVVNRMGMLGDISQGSADKLNRVASAYGQMSSLGKVQLQDIKQMIEAGFNPLNEISERTGESMESLYDRISKGTLSVDEITASMEASTSEGGKYFQSMEKQSKTFNGLMSTLKDNAMSALGAITTGLSDIATSSVLPMLIGYVEDLATAFNEGGFEGLISKFGEVLGGIFSQIGAVAPQIVEGALSLLQSFADAIIQNIPTLVPAVIEIVTSIGLFMLENLPMLIDAAVSIIAALAQGISEQAPTLIPAIVQTMLTIMQTLINNIPMLINASIQLMMGLARGLIAAIPLLVQQIPTIINSLMSAITQNAPMLIQASFDIMIALASGLIQAIPQLLKSIPQIIASIFKAFNAISGKMLEVGMNIVRGIWQGISNGTAWIFGKISGWVGSVLAYIKGLFGIKSPSTVMREEVGKMLSYGLGDGILKYAGYAQNAMSSLMSGIMGETYNPVINPTVNGSTGLYGAALASAGGMGGVTIGAVNFNQPLQSTTQAAKLFGRKLVGELYA